jgi:hypothetical protein
MSARQPPRLAKWLVEIFASGYRRDALVGDLFEEYAQGRSELWYWKQAGFVLLHAARRVLSAAGRIVRSMLPNSVTSLLRRTTRRLVAILAVAALGVGTLTWAATTYAPSCSAHTASCHKTR